MTALLQLGAYLIGAGFMAVKAYESFRDREKLYVRIVAVLAVPVLLFMGYLRARLSGWI